MRMCSAFTKLDIDVKLLCRSKIKFHDLEDVFSYYGIKNKTFKINYLKEFKSNKISSLKYAFWTVFKCLSNNYNNIYSRNQLSSILILLFTRKKIFIELHSPPTGLYKFIFNIYLRTSRISKLILISDALKKIIKNNFSLIPDDKILVCHDGADIFSDKKLKIKINKGDTNVGYVGHLYQGRGIEKIIQLAKRNKKVHFHIIGGEDLDILYWKKKSNLKNVFFYGHIEPKSIPSYLLEFDILIAPYQNKVFLSNGMNTADWMSPLKLFEYMSSGKPILTSDLPVIKEVLKHKVNAYLCNPKSINDWNEGLNYFILNPCEAKKISQKAFKDLVNLYTWDSRSKKISKYFE